MNDAAADRFPRANGSASGYGVGFVGLGRMGAAMVGRLVAAGVAITGYDVSDAARAALSDVPGLRLVDRIAEVAAGNEVVVLMVPDSDAVEAALEAGLLAALASGTVLVDMGSSEPARTLAVAERLRAVGCRFVDAPVSGGVAGARKGTLTVMVGGDEDTVAFVRPVLDVVGGRLVPAGGVGSGHAVKALNNLMSATHLLVTAEALAAATRFGLDARVFLDIVNTSSGRSGSTDVKMPDYVLTGTFDSGFDLRLMLKDMRIALGVEENGGAGCGLSRAAVAVWAEAAEALPPTADHTEIARWVDPDGVTGS
jgi:3-hydroxyisobutyrate dehydrogenase